MNGSSVRNHQKIILQLGLAAILGAVALSACQDNTPIIETQITIASNSAGSVALTLPENVDSDRRYLFYIHGKIIEDEGVDAVSPQFGPYEFEQILNYLSDAEFNVIGEIRSTPTDANEYSDRVAAQVKSLLAQGVPSKHITIVGFSKGAGIAILTSAKLNNPELNIVLIAICGEETNDEPSPAISGRILSLFERSDELGSSCKPLADRSHGVIEFKEIEFSTGKHHGAFYAADPIWLDPIISWIDEVDS